MFKLGGIRSPNRDALDMRAEDTPLGYPAAYIRGSIMVPIEERVAKPLPEIAPNSAQEMTMTAPSPPRIRPTNISTRLMRLSPIPLFSIRFPDRMNKGIATKMRELTLLNP
jgi:hypothetical protein